jgi:cell wall-associated NlpC family hydrolase
MTGDEFVNAWIGTPFAWDGRTQAGVDCWGLVWRFHADCLDLELPDWIKGARNRGWLLTTFAAERESHWQALADPEPGCIVLAMPAGRPAHVGIFWRGGVLHAAEGAGVIWQPLPAFALVNGAHEFGRYQPDAVLLGGAAA